MTTTRCSHGDLRAGVDHRRRAVVQKCLRHGDGAIGLLMRKYWASLAFSFSLIAIIIQFSYPFLIASGAQSDIAMLAFPMFVIVMAVVQWQLSRHWQRKGWLA